MYVCQCKRCQVGQNSGVLLKEVSAFRRYMHMHADLLVQHPL